MKDTLKIQKVDKHNLVSKSLSNSTPFFKNKAFHSNSSTLIGEEKEIDFNF